MVSAAAFSCFGAGQAVSHHAPDWTPIMTPGQPLKYFKYSETTKIEVDWPANRTALPYHFHEPDSPSTASGLLSGVCSFPSAAPDAPPFWFDFSGNPLAGKFKTPIPSEYFVSPVRSGKSGFGVQLRGGFGGKASGSGVLYETAYFHQQPCDAGGLEFGFYRNLIAAQTVFYFSNNSNCGIQPNSYCHVSNSYSSNYMNEDNAPGQALTSNINGWAINNLNTEGTSVQLSNLSYSVFILPDLSAPRGYRFQVEVFEPGTSRHVNCSVYDTSGHVLFENKACDFPVRPGSWYEIDRLHNSSASGYVTVGIQRQGTPAIAAPIDFQVDQISVPK